jgi:hypothetical protein
VQPISSEPTTDGDLSGQDQWAERDRERQRELAERLAASREAAREMTAQWAAEVLARSRDTVKPTITPASAEWTWRSARSARPRRGPAGLRSRPGWTVSERLASPSSVWASIPEPAITAVLQRRSQERAREEELELALELEGPQR